MSTLPRPLTPPSPSMLPSLRSLTLGAKFFLLVLLALLMSLSGFVVEGLAAERASNHGVLAASSDDPSGQPVVLNGSQPGATQPAKAGPANVLGIPLADSYRSTRRALHYIALFLGLVFLTYFLFEVSTGRSVHPAQYALVGVAQTVFYLLLLSLAEQYGFDLSFLIAGTATVALFSMNAHWLFHSRRLALRALGIFAALYAFIYVLLRVEAYALLTGAIASFAAVAAAMYITRNLDWYGTARNASAAPAGATAADGRSSWLD